MKILCLADIHVRNSKDRKQKFHWIKKLVSANNPDVIVIAGDVFENEEVFRRDPYQLLSTITDNEIPIICCLGNHEFCNHTVNEVHKAYEKKFNPEKYNVTYLDVTTFVDVLDKEKNKYVRFFGNVLWYDGSTKAFEDQELYDWAGPDSSWLDKFIINFDYMKEHIKCVDRIKHVVKLTDSYGGDNYIKVLVTHCVPHIDLNGHERTGVFNAYSGVKNLLKDINIDYSISGHTHKRVVGLTREGCDCINVGNDYHPPYNYYLLEI